MKKLFLIVLMVAFWVPSTYADTVRIFSQGEGLVTVAASEKITVFTQGTAKVYKKSGWPNIISSWALLATVTNKTYLSAAVTSATDFKIEADAYDVWYSTDGTPDIQLGGPSVQMKSQRTPAADTTGDTFTVDEMMSGIITYTGTNGASVALTLPTGTQMDGSSDAASFAIGDSFDWVVINLSAAAADTATITASTGHTIVGTAIIQSANASTGLLYGNAVMFRTRKTAANTFVTYRIGG